METTGVNKRAMASDIVRSVKRDRLIIDENFILG